MRLSFCSFSSGSSVNCYFIKTETTALLVDAGISGRKILKGLSQVGVLPEEVNGILMTHEHSDHVKSIRVLSKKLAAADFFASGGTWEQVMNQIPEAQIPEVRRKTAAAGETFLIGDIRVTPFRLSHDAAEPIGYSFEAGGRGISIVTDTGCITEEIHQAVRFSDLLVLEANHDIQMLEFCRYPYSVKRRILGYFGHLSNEAAAEEICRICTETGGYREILLAHLSRENNFPEMAYQTVRNLLEERGLRIGRHLELHVIGREELSPVFLLDGEAETKETRG